MENQNQIKEILDHIDLGILAFDRGGIIGSGLSRASQRLFKQAHLEGMNVVDVFKLDSEKIRNDFKGWINMAYQVHERLPWEKISHLCPLEKWDLFQQKLESRYVPMVKDGKLDKILMISKDVTKEFTLAQEAKDERARRLSESETLTIMMEAPEKSLSIFLYEMKSRHITLSRLSRRAWSEGSYTLALRCIHTIKGSSSLLNLNELTKLAHQLESTMITLKEPLLEGKAQNDFMDVFNPLSSCCLRLMNWGEKLKLFSSEGREQKDLKVPSVELKAVLTWVRQHPEAHQDPFWVSHFQSLHQLTTMPCQELVLRFENIVIQLSDTLEKKAKLTCLFGHKIRLHHSFWVKWIDPLNHLIRNAICHGVERPEEREQQGKQEVAVLQLNFELVTGIFSVSVSDDGKGIDTESLFKKWKTLNPETTELSREEKINLIFEAGLSNASEVDHISGRGVGMDIVKTMAESLGGHISVETQLGSGTTFKISVPYHDPILGDGA